MATIILYVTKPTPLAYCKFTIKYRKVGTSDPYTYITPDLEDFSLTQYKITINVDASIANYEGYIKANCDKIRCSNWVYFVTDNDTGTSWVTDEFICESDDFLDISAQYTGYSSPTVTHYYNGYVYVADADSILGFVYKFLPSDAANFPGSPPDFLTFFAGGDDSMSGTPSRVFYQTVVDEVNHRFLMVGNFYGGLVVFDMTTETYYINGTGTSIIDGIEYNSELAYGTNGSFQRLNISFTGDYIYASHRATNLAYIWNRVALTKVNSGVDISSGTNIDLYNAFYDGFQVNQIDTDEIWMNCGNNNQPVPFIYRFKVDLSAGYVTPGTPYTKIPLPDAVPSLYYGRYYTGSYYDPLTKKYYIGITGNDTTGNVLHVFDADPTSVTYTQLLTTLDFNGIKGAKRAASTSVIKDAFSNELLISYTGNNNSTVSGIDPSPDYRFYTLNASDTITNVLYKQAAANLSYQDGTNPPTLWGCSGGLRQWESGAWQTDGKIIKYIR